MFKSKLNQPQNHDFFCNYYPQFFIVLMGSLFLFIILIGIVLYQLTHVPLPTFIAVNPHGKKMELTSYQQPNLLPDTILQWARKATTVAYTFDFVNYDKQIALARPYFTDAGWRDYQASVSDLINSIVQNQLFINGIVSDTPVISNQGPLPGLGYVWRLQIPFLVTYQSANTVTKQKFTVLLTIVEVPTEVNPQGIGIDQFVMR